MVVAHTGGGGIIPITTATTTVSSSDTGGVVAEQENSVGLRKCSQVVKVCILAKSIRDIIGHDGCA